MADVPPLKYPNFTYSEHLHKYTDLNLEKIRKTLRVEKAVGSIAIIALKPQPCILLLLRAEDDPAFPGTWDIPSGGLDPRDPSIIHGAARETLEEAGLPEFKISDLAIFLPFKHFEKDEMFASWTFLALFDEKPEIKVNEKEHSIYMWCNFEEFPKLRSKVMNDIKRSAIDSAIMAYRRGGGFSETAFF
jgi:8-oxo-dGTP pyrophosphatase MutT (NUDIX family)